jgi:hypothetical protein
MFMIVDDLRAELGSNGCDQIKTPNLDRLANGTRSAAALRCFTKAGQDDSQRVSQNSVGRRKRQ